MDLQASPRKSLPKTHRSLSHALQCLHCCFSKALTQHSLSSSLPLIQPQGGARLVQSTSSLPSQPWQGRGSAEGGLGVTERVCPQVLGGRVLHTPVHVAPGDETKPQPVLPQTQMENTAPKTSPSSLLRCAAFPGVAIIKDLIKDLLI